MNFSPDHQTTPSPQEPIYLLRFSQTHLSFRRAELEALTTLLNHALHTSRYSPLISLLRDRGLDPRRLSVKVQVVRYSDEAPFCLLRFRVVRLRSGRDTGDLDENPKGDVEVKADEEVVACIAREFVGRAVQGKGIWEVWGLAGADVSEDGKRTGKQGSDDELIINRTDVTAQATTRATKSSTGVVTDNIPSTTPPSSTSPATTAHTAPLSTPVHPLYVTLHTDTHQRSSHRWHPYQISSTLKFKFSIDTFNHSRSTPEQRDIINSFAYLDFGGLVRMKDANEEWVVFEEWVGMPSLPIGDGVPKGISGDLSTDRDGEPFDNTHRSLHRLYLGRTLSTKTLRPLKDKHDLKKRPYISTTSMDAELALITANLALAAPGKIFLDPFCGTGGFLIAAAELGAWVLGSDIDGRSFRGKSDRGVSSGVGKNVQKYHLQSRFGGCLTSDLVNTPFQTARRWLDGIVCDPPYGVREGLKVLGTRNAPAQNGEEPRQPHLIDGVPAYTLPGYIAPKKPYSFERMLDDVLDFAARTLVDGGRLAFWMPSANENELGAEVETAIPEHPALLLKHVCVQRFNRWSRRLLVYERRSGDYSRFVNEVATGIEQLNIDSTTADDLNPFRRRYFQAFAVNNDPSV